MSQRLFQYLISVYEKQKMPVLRSKRSIIPIQIDDQDDNDNLNDFCTVFIVVKKKGSFHIELSGKIPITTEISDLAEIYDGYASETKGKISLTLNPLQIDVLLDLASRLKKTAFLGPRVKNPNWHRISARTISSLYRFVRTIKEFRTETHRLD